MHLWKEIFMANMDMTKQVVEELSKNFSNLDKNKDGAISKEEFKNIGMPKLTPEDRIKYFENLANKTGDKNSIDKNDLATANRDLDATKFGISTTEAHKFVNDPEVQMLCKLQQTKWDIEDGHRKAGGDINDPRFKGKIEAIDGLISEQEEKVVPAVKSLLGISEDTVDLNNIKVSKSVFKNRDGTREESVLISHKNKDKDTYNYGNTTLSRTGEVLFSDKEKYETMNKIIDAMVIAHKDGRHLGTSQMEKIANTLAADHLLEGEKIIISKTPIDSHTSKSPKVDVTSFSVEGVEHPFGYSTEKLGSVSSVGGNIKVSTSDLYGDTYLKERGLKD